MRIYIFKSETTRGLRAFAGDPAGSKLPENHGPWSVTGVVADNKAPPHKLSREVIERAIADEDFSYGGSARRHRRRREPHPVSDTLLSRPSGTTRAGRDSVRRFENPH